MPDYNVEDPGKVQGRDDVFRNDRNLGALRLDRLLSAIEGTGGKILLLGCGAGRYARAISRELSDRAVFGGDLSLTALREAVSAGQGPHYLALDAQRLPFRDGTVGAVVFLDLLEHVPDPDEMLAECARVLVPGGVLHYFLPLEDEPGTLYHLLRNDRPIPIHRWKEHHVGHIKRFRRGDVLRRTWKAGLPVTHTSYSFHLIGQVHDLVDYWHRERTAGGTGRIPVGWVSRITRAVFIVTWRLSYLEDRFYQGARSASGIHVTARKTGATR